MVKYLLEVSNQGNEENNYNLFFKATLNIDLEQEIVQWNVYELMKKYFVRRCIWNLSDSCDGCYCRSSRPEVFCKKGVLRNFAKFTGQQLCQSH